MTVAVEAISFAPLRTFWRRRALAPIVAQPMQGITPEKKDFGMIGFDGILVSALAASFAGIAIFTVVLPGLRGLASWLPPKAR